MDDKPWDALVQEVAPEVNTRIREMEFACGDATVTVCSSDQRTTVANPEQYDVYEFPGDVLVDRAEYTVAVDYATRLARARGTQKVIQDMASMLEPARPVVVR